MRIDPNNQEDNWKYKISYAQSLNAQIRNRLISHIYSELRNRCMALWKMRAQYHKAVDEEQVRRDRLDRGDNDEAMEKFLNEKLIEAIDRLTVLRADIDEQYEKILDLLPEGIFD